MSTSAERMRRMRAGEPHQPSGRPVTEPCGTLAAWRRHQRHGETCDECRLARNAWQRAQRAAKKVR